MNQDQLISWLLDSDVSVQYQVHRDLLCDKRSDLKEKILTEGWGKQFMSFRKPEGYWGTGFYHPKWISSHYTLLDLKSLSPIQNDRLIQESIFLIADNEKSEDGGVNPARSIKQSDVCVNGMFLDYASYFKVPQTKLISVIDFILSQQLNDGGFNCMLNRSGAVHSSLHSTISVCEGFREYIDNGYLHRRDEVIKAENEAQEFILRHKLFLSDRTGEIINPAFLKLSYPGRWKYDILRALDYFRAAKVPYDIRMQAALDVLIKKRRKDGTWPVQAKHPGQTHFDYEKPGTASRWNTLRALRVLSFYKSNMH